MKVFLSWSGAQAREFALFLFEAGAISRSVGESAVVPLLLDLAKTDVVGPLSRFQAVDAGSRQDVFRMSESVNAPMARPLEPAVLAHVADWEWDGFAAAASRAGAPADRPPARSEREVLAEILETVRTIERNGRPEPETFARGLGAATVAGRRAGGGSTDRLPDGYGFGQPGPPPGG